MIEFNKVVRSYNGRSGCMCGCRGTYSVPTHSTNEDERARSKVSDRSVKIAIKKINDAINWNDPKDVEKHVNEDHAYIDDGSRNTVVYFK